VDWASFWTWKAYHLQDVQLEVRASYFLSEQYEVLGTHFLSTLWNPYWHFPRIGATSHCGVAEVSPIPRALHSSFPDGVTAALAAAALAAAALAAASLAAAVAAQVALVAVAVVLASFPQVALSAIALVLASVLQVALAASGFASQAVLVAVNLVAAAVAHAAMVLATLAVAAVAQATLAAAAISTSVLTGTAWHRVISRAETAKIFIKVFMALKFELGIIDISVVRLKWRLGGRF
jgi:hypothetical protein